MTENSKKSTVPHATKQSSSRTRTYYGSNKRFMMVLGAMMVGISNIWRFPYLLNSNGGAIFIVPYLFATFFYSMPMMLMEIGLG